MKKQLSIWVTLTSLTSAFLHGAVLVNSTAGEWKSDRSDYNTGGSQIPIFQGVEGSDGAVLLTGSDGARSTISYTYLSYDHPGTINVQAGRPPTQGHSGDSILPVSALLTTAIDVRWKLMGESETPSDAVSIYAEVWRDQTSGSAQWVGNLRLMLSEAHSNPDENGWVTTSANGSDKLWSITGFGTPAATGPRDFAELVDLGVDIDNLYIATIWIAVGKSVSSPSGVLETVAFDAISIGEGFSFNFIPEPSSALLAGLSLVGLMRRRR